jgi:ABC-2 type transport system ATP-binding protein
VGAAIEIQGVSKRFRLYHEKYSSLKERILHAGKIPYEEFWAVRDVEAEIDAGKTVGILGRNGSGKSTLLKCVAGILQPTSGQVVLRGSLAAMLELGAGFQPELSGRDNIYLNGSLLGFSRKDIDSRFDAIVEFAELGGFIDNQVKYYSSGMYVRLGFAVAVNVEPDILLVDEVLAVGDERFQEKCLDRVREFQQEGRTIVVVSHSPDMLRRVCDEVFVIDGGHLVDRSAPNEGIQFFRERLRTAGITLPVGDRNLLRESAPRPQQHFVKFGDVELDHAKSAERAYLIAGDSFSVTAHLQVFEPVPGAEFAIVITTTEGENVFGTIVAPSGGARTLSPGEHAVRFDVRDIPLLDGLYLVNVDVRDGSGVVLDFIEGGVHFTVVKTDRSNGFVTMPVTVELDPSNADAAPASASGPFPLR